MTIRGREAASPVAEAAPQMSELEQLLEQYSGKIGDPAVIEKAVKSAVLAAAAELMRKKKATMYQIAEENWQRPSWQGKATVVLEGVGVVATAGFFDHVIERYVVGNDSSFAERLLQKVFG